MKLNTRTGLAAAIVFASVAVVGYAVFSTPESLRAEYTVLGIGGVVFLNLQLFRYRGSLSDKVVESLVGSAAASLAAGASCLAGVSYLVETGTIPGLPTFWQVLLTFLLGIVCARTAWKATAAKTIEKAVAAAATEDGLDSLPRSTATSSEQKMGEEVYGV